MAKRHKFDPQWRSYSWETGFGDLLKKLKNWSIKKHESYKEEVLEYTEE